MEGYLSIFQGAYCHFRWGGAKEVLLGLGRSLVPTPRSAFISGAAGDHSGGVAWGAPHLLSGGLGINGHFMVLFEGCLAYFFRKKKIKQNRLIVENMEMNPKMHSRAVRMAESCPTWGSIISQFLKLVPATSLGARHPESVTGMWGALLALRVLSSA